MKLYKKGELPWWLGLMVIVAIFIVVILFISGKIFSGFSEATMARQVENKIDACEGKGQRLEERGELVDSDKDGLPDSCDNCPNVPNFGDEVQDKDLDGFPAYKDATQDVNKLCCAKVKGSNPAGDQIDKYCETLENDEIYGPRKLITYYLNPAKS